MKAKFKKRRGLYISLACFFAVIIISTVTVTAVASGPASEEALYPVPVGTPAPAGTPSPEDIARDLGTEEMWELQERIEGASTQEERNALYEELLEVRIERGEIRIREVSGPATRGIETCIAGKTVKLPDDAWIRGIMVTWLVITPDSAKAYNNRPVMIINSGNSTIGIGINTGVVTGGRVAPGEEGSFDFLKRVFPDQQEAIDSLPVEEPPPPIDWPTFEWEFGTPEVEE